MTSCVVARRKSNVLIQQLLKIAQENSNRQECKDKKAREFPFSELLISLREAYLFDLLDTLLDLHLFLKSQNQDLAKFCVKIRILIDRYCEWFNVTNQWADWPW